MVFCLPSNFYKVEFLPELKKMRFTLKSGLGDVTSSWRVAANEGINQYSTQDICVNNPVNASFPSVGAGTYQIKIENPHPFPVSFVLRLRTNFTNLYDPLSVVRNRLIQQARADGETLTLESLNNDLCNIDSSQSLPAETTHTLSIPICPDILFFIQVYNLGGRPCSQVIQSEIDYTSVGLNRTQNVVVVERITNNVVLQTAREIENSLNEMRKEITVEIEDIKLTLADSFFKLNGSNEFLTNSYRALNDILSNQQSGVVNIWNRVVVAEVLFQRLNTSYSDVSAALNEVRAFTQAVRERSEVLLDDVFVGIERLDNLTVLSNAVYESAARNEINFMVLEDKIAEINNLIETAKGLGPAVEILNAIDKDNVEANKSLTMLISVVGSVAGLALIVFLGYIYYKTKKRSQKYSQMQGNDEDGGDQQ